MIPQPAQPRKDKERLGMFRGGTTASRCVSSTAHNSVPPPPGALKTNRMDQSASAQLVHSLQNHRSASQLQSVAL